MFTVIVFEIRQLYYCLAQTFMQHTYHSQYLFIIIDRYGIFLFCAVVLGNAKLAEYFPMSACKGRALSGELYLALKCV